MHFINKVVHARNASYGHLFEHLCAGVLEMAQKVIEGGVVTWRHMHEILRWLNFKLAQNLRSRRKNSEPSRGFEPSQSLRSEKVNHLGVLTRDQDSEPTRSWAIPKSHAYAFTWRNLLRWLFEPSQGPPRNELWNICSLDSCLDSHWNQYYFEI